MGEELSHLCPAPRRGVAISRHPTAGADPVISGTVGSRGASLCPSPWVRRQADKKLSEPT